MMTMAERMAYADIFPQLTADGPACRGDGPAVDDTQWGYAIHDRTRHPALRALIAQTARFAGSFMLFAAMTLMVMPDVLEIVGIVSMKVAWLIMFAVFGALLVRSGQIDVHPEVHIDLNRREVRFGRRGLQGQFCRSGALEFNDIASVYLLRSKETARPVRLYLRFGDGFDAIEVARGPIAALEHLRVRLAADLNGETRKPKPKSRAGCKDSPLRRRVKPRRIAP